jgi:kynurenine formamidase
MKIQSLSYYINNETPVYGGYSEKINIESARRISDGDTTNEMTLSFNNHVSTHIDFPKHFSDNGKTINDYEPSFWVFRNVGFLNCNLDNVKKNLDILDSNIEILILKTDFGRHRGENVYWKNQPVIPSNLASILKNKFKKLRAFGFDLISLTSKLDREEGKKAHLEFLINNDILIIEDMSLSKLKKTPKMIVVSPLMIDKADGVPCNILSFS